MAFGGRTGPTPARRILGDLAVLGVIVMLASLLPGPARAQGANGCHGELAGAWGVICPTDADQAASIVYVMSTADGASIRLTQDGVRLGTTCDGAARIVWMSSGLYARLPADQRSATNLLWAEPYITSEVMGHSVAAATNIPELVAHGNPIDIVFADYSTPGSQGLFWRSLDNPDHVFAPGACPGNVTK